jgi:hypothetical protein
MAAGWTAGIDTRVGVGGAVDGAAAGARVAEALCETEIDGDGD